jgi:hypothetical protein
MDINELLAWVQTIFVKMGVWDAMTTTLTVLVILASARMVIRFVNGR